MLSSNNILTPFIILILYFFIIHFLSKSESYSLVSSPWIFIIALLLGDDLSKMLDWLIDLWLYLNPSMLLPTIILWLGESDASLNESFSFSSSWIIWSGIDYFWEVFCFLNDFDVLILLSLSSTSLKWAYNSWVQPNLSSDHSCPFFSKINKININTYP